MTARRAARLLRWALVAAAAVGGAVAVSALARAVPTMWHHPPSGTGWAWLGGGAAVVAAGYTASAVALRITAGRPLPIGRTVLTQLAAAAGNRVTPIGLGAAAVNTRYLVVAGLSTAEAATAVALVAMANAVVSAAALLLTSAAAWHSVDRFTDLAQTAGPVLLAVLVVVAVGLPLGWRRLPARGRDGWRQARTAVVTLARTPRRLALLLTVTAAVKTAQVLALLAALHAAGAHLSPVLVALVYLAGTAAGGAVPTPAGVGGVEAALTAGLVAAGGAMSVVLTGVVLYRLVSFWLPVVPGCVAGAVLRRRHAI